MKTTPHQQKPAAALIHGAAPTRTAAYSALMFLGAVLALTLLSGCASSNVGGSADPLEYNPNTGYPAVGDLPWK